ncbi:hypothetical protein QF042_004315 [Pedobacter sp. W3I1]|nr:hypothetical protein [Pedobacter sp. W3I1]
MCQMVTSNTTKIIARADQHTTNIARRESIFKKELAFVFLHYNS